MISDQSLIPKLGELCRHGAAVDKQIIGQLLTVKGNGETGSPLTQGTCGEKAEKLFACGAAGKVLQLLGERDILLGKYADQIADQAGMEATGAGAGR